MYLLEYLTISRLKTEKRNLIVRFLFLRKSLSPQNRKKA